MKYFFIFIILFFCISSSCVSTKNVVDENCSKIIDSAKVFLQTSESAINIKPTLKDNERNLKLDNWFQNLSFKKLTCLLNNENVALKFVGFTYAAFAHSDSLEKNYSNLLTDTTTVQFCYADGKIGDKMKFGELLFMMVQKINEDSGNPGKRPSVETIISKFIIQYATYPGTYKPISFTYYSPSSANDSILNLDVSHEYEIKNNSGVTSSQTNTFVLDKNLEISAINKNNVTYPINIDYWLKEFGRKLSKRDSLLLKLL